MSNLTRNRSFIGGGSLYLKQVGAAVAMIEVGNADSFSFAIGEEKKTQRNFTQKGGGNIASQSAITDVTATVNALSFQPKTLAVALRSLVNTNAAGSVADEDHTAYEGGYIILNEIPDLESTITVTGSGGTPTYAVDDDYTVENGGIKITNGGAIADGTAIEVTYTNMESYDIQGITQAALEYEVIFDGFNDADDGKTVTVRCHKVKFSPSSALELISEDYGSLPLTFDVLADTTKNGSSESQYFEMKMQA